MLPPKKPKKTTNKPAPKEAYSKIKKTTKKVADASIIAQLLNKIPGAETIYDIVNIGKSLNEGDYKNILSNTIGSLIPGVSGKAIEAITEDWLPKTPEIEKRKFKFNLNTSNSDRQKYFKKYGQGYLSNPQFIKDFKLDQPEDMSTNQKLAFGTNSQGIMKRKINIRKKYANGTDMKGMDPNNYIISPEEALNQYNVDLAKAEQEASSNIWLPIVAIAGQALQSGISIAGNAAIKNASNGTDEDGDEKEGSSVQKKAMGTNNVQEDVEVEGGEMYETPQGQVGMFQGPSHEQGGIPLELGKNVEEGTKVYSDRLKIGNKTLADRKATRERQIANLEKIASNNLADEAVKNAAKRKMMAIQKEEMADLQYQDQVNNIQAMADTMVQTFACGTGMGGMKKYDDGTGPEGIMGEPPIYRLSNISFEKNPYEDPKNYDTNAIKNLHDALGILSTERGYGKAVGDKTLKAYQDFLTRHYPNSTANQFPNLKNRIYKNKKIDIPLGEAQALGLTTEGYKYTGPKSKVYSKMGKDIKTNMSLPDVSMDSLISRGFETEDPFAMTAGEDWKKANPLPEGIEEPISRTIDYKSELFPEGFSVKEKDKKKKKERKKGDGADMFIPGIGDMTKLIGNYLGMTANIRTAAEQRSTDIPFSNVFERAGEESQRLLDRAKEAAEINKAQAIVNATSQARAGKRGARGSARGVNTMRATDWLYDTALQQQTNEIMNNAFSQMAQLDAQKSQVALSADQLKGEGALKASLANEAAKDAYYTALGLGRKDFATGLQQTGADINEMLQNRIVENMMKNYGDYVGIDESGKMFARTKKSSKQTSKEKEDLVEVEIAGKKYKITKSQLKELTKNP